MIYFIYETISDDLINTQESNLNRLDLNNKRIKKLMKENIFNYDIARGKD